MTKRTGFLLLAAATAGIFLLQAAEYKDAYVVKDEKDVLQASDQWTKAIQAGDTATLERVLADDYRMVDPAGKSLSKAQEIALYQSGEVKFESFSTSDQKVKIYIGGAVVTGKASVKGKHKDEDISGDYVFVDIYERRKTGWQPVYSQLTKVETEADKKKKAETNTQPK
jgi:ketosteroid isomerase-like protein